MSLRYLTLIALCCLLPLRANAETAGPGSGAGPLGKPAEQSIGDRLLSIHESIKAADAERAALKQHLSKAPTEAEATEVVQDLKRLTRRLEELNTAFEELATGGTSIAAIEKAVEKKPVDWKQELEDIVRPILEVLKRMTERPRRIEHLRGERELYEDRLVTADRAIAQIGENIGETETAAVKQALVALRKEWASRRADAESGLQLVTDQLQRLLAPEADEGPGVAAALRDFFSGRGLSLLLALTSFTLTYALLAAIGRRLDRVWLRRYDAGGHRFVKVAGILFGFLSVAASFFAAMLVLYVRGDWLILGLLILFLFGLVLALRNALPRYVDEMRILLNMGGVREGERVVYNGIPWQIRSLNVFSTLHNPLLRGGRIRVPIDAIGALQSRQYAKEEPWFPSRENDYVILDSDLFGKVLIQTPEVVQLQVAGATKTFGVAHYLSQNPRDLSLGGFAVPLSFGLDYRHQAEILTAIVPEMRAHLEERLAEQVFRPHLKDLVVEFNEAASSALNLIIVGVFEGAAAEHYWAIRRFLQRTAVEACNRRGWNIPFDQLTVHLEGCVDTATSPSLAE